ncbi:hypothetical protein [Synechococcus sp. UW140]|uniref:hypothetical protein n=1 Tax=Synechococcus sp. UW140 TaxID=368503 RepID=UPI0025D6A0C0|nr:hypothetical protein [Synechococcus sp. UW140]
MKSSAGGFIHTISDCRLQRGYCPPPGMACTGLFIKISTLFANCYRLTAMPVLVIVPIYKRGNPLKGLDLVIHAHLVGLAPAAIA